MADPTIRITAVDATRAAFASASRNLDQLKSSAMSLKAGIAGVAVSLGGLAIAQQFREAVDAADQLDELSQKVGVSAETISSLGLAIKLGGTDIDGFSSGLKKLSVNMADAQRGAGEAADAFKALGINVESGPGALRNVDEVLLDIAEKFEGTADGANKTALAVAIFGKAGADLVPFLNQGKDGIEALRKEAERLGIVVSNDTARAAGQFKDNLDILAESAKATTNSLIAALLPSLVKITDQMRLAAQQGGFFSGVLAGLRESLIQTFTTSTAGKIEETNRKIAEQLQLIERLESTTKRRGTLGAGREEQIAGARRGLEALKQESLALQELLKFETPGGLRSGVPEAPKPQAPQLPKKGPESKPSDDFESTIKGLKQQLEATEALTEFEKILAGIQSGRIKLSADPKVAQSQREQLELAAAQLDLAREDKQLREEVARVLEEANRQSAEQLRREAEALNAAAARYRDLADPVEKYREQLEEIWQLLNRGLLTDEQAVGAAAAIGKQIDDLNNKVEKGKSLAEELGLTFTSAFEEAVAGGAGFRDILKGIESDLLKLGTRKLITEPVGKWFEGLFKGGGGAGGGGGGGVGDFFGSILGGVRKLLGFADGGSFTVGGAGGIDSQLVAFRATPGERVDVTPPGRGGGAGAVIGQLVINMPPNVTRDTIQQTAARFGQVAQLAQARNR